MVHLPNQRSADRFTTFSCDCLLSVSIDQLDKTAAPLIPEVYIYLLDVQCLISLSDGLAGYTFPLYNTLAVQKPPATESVRAPGPLDPTTLLDRFQSMTLMCDALHSFIRAPTSLHQHAWAIWSAGGHEYRPGGRGESLLGRLKCDTDKMARGGP